MKQFFCLKWLLVPLLVLGSATCIFANDVIEVKFKPGITPQVKKVPGKDSLVTLSFKDPSLDVLFSAYQVKACYQSYPSASLFPQHPLAAGLLRVYSFVLGNEGNALMRDLLLYKGGNIESQFFVYPPISLYTPNDFNLDRKMNFNNCVETGDGPMHNLKLVNAERAWDITKGSPQTIIGISDIGFNFDHEDLTNKMVGNNPLPSVFFGRHGTMVASAAGAETDNNVGIAGMCPECKLAAFAWVDYNGMLTAANEGVKVMNCSWTTGCYFSQYQQDVIDIVTDNGMTIVAAAGNGDPNYCPGEPWPNGDPAQFIVYPAGYNNVISVSGVGSYFDNSVPLPDPCTGRISHKDVHVMKDWSVTASYTMQHNTAVDVVAPAHHVKTATWNGPNTNDLYDYLTSGTSIAAPIVAGIAGLMYSYCPNIKPAEVETIIKCTAEDIYSIPYNYPYTGLLGTGRVNAFQALSKTADKCANTPLNVRSYYLGKFGVRKYLTEDNHPSHTIVCGLAEAVLPNTVIYHEVTDPDPSYTGSYKWKFSFNQGYVYGTTVTCLASDLDRIGQPLFTYVDVARDQNDLCNNPLASLHYRETFARSGDLILCDMTYKGTPGQVTDNTAPLKPSLYPNPVTDRLTIRTTDGFAAFEIMNINGQPVQKGGAEAKPLAAIDVRSLSSGIYTIRVTQRNGEIIVLKFVKM